ncbi:hypothetical protein BDF14DRAFT_1835886 [Spinellus fusiger]|nr:hypothetical protein BDF14DRAFT_1835886 [Spinellus fusiger]
MGYMFMLTFPKVTSAVGAAPSAIRSALSSAGVTLPTGASASHPVSSAATLKASATATGIHSGANYSSQANLFQGFIVALVSVGFYFQAYV